MQGICAVKLFYLINYNTVKSTIC